jgi:hypothetical protein
MAHYPSSDQQRPRVHTPAVAIAAAISMGGTLFIAVVLLPGVAEILAGLSQPVAFGLVLPLTTGVRVLAGVMGARSYRRAHALEQRRDSMLSVLLGVAVGLLCYEIIALSSAAAYGMSVSWLLVGVELLRWLAEGALGAFIVNPGEREELDPALRRFLLRPERSR